MVRFFGMNRLLFELHKCSSETSLMCKERMLQLILRAEVDINEESKQRNKVGKSRLYLNHVEFIFRLKSHLF